MKPQKMNLTAVNAVKKNFNSDYSENFVKLCG